MRIVLIWALLCALLLSGCAPAGAMFPEALVTRAQAASAAELAEENIVLKLFPLEAASRFSFTVCAEADDKARALLGDDLERLAPSYPLLAAAMLTNEPDAPAGLADVLPALCLLFPEGLSMTADGRIFLPAEQLGRWAEALGQDAEEVASSLAYDEGNDGYLLPGEETAPELQLELLAAVEKPGDGLCLDVSAASGDSTWRALLHIDINDDDTLRLRAAEPLDTDAGPFWYIEPSLNLTERVEYPALKLSLMEGDGLRVQETEAGLRLSLALPGTVRLGDGSAPEPRAALYVQQAEADRPRVEESAYASAAAAQQGCAEQGQELVDLHLGGCNFLGSNDAFVLRYTVLDKEGAPLMSVEHYIAEMQNDELYHFVFRFLPGYTQNEMDLLYKAAQTLRFS